MTRPSLSRGTAIRIAMHLLVLAFGASLWIAYGRKVGGGFIVGGCLGYMLGHAEGIFAALGTRDDE